MSARSFAHMIAGLLLAALLTCGCARLSPAGGDPLDGTSWRLTSYDGQDPIPGSEVTITFYEGSVQGSAGCNTFHGHYQIQGSTLTFDELAATEMACLEPQGIMEQEQAIMGTLWGAQSFERQGDRLKILRSDGAGLVYDQVE